MEDKEIEEFLKPLISSLNTKDFKKQTTNIQFDYDKFPKIDFFLKKGENPDLNKKLEVLINFQYPEKNNSLDSFSELEKALIGFIWKQGDYRTLLHFIEGILNCDNGMNKSVETKGLVMYHFGKHIKNPIENPIIDQHVIRAYRYFIYEKKENELEIRKNEDISKIKEIEEIVRNYKIWFNEIAEKLNLSDKSLLDKYLFSIGKQLKIKNKK